jgi:RING finger protein 113A
MFKKVKKNSLNIRKRTAEEDPENNEPESQVEESTGSVPLPAALKEKRKRDDGALSSTMANKKSNSLSDDLRYSASGAAASLIPQDMNATAIEEIDTEKDRDSRAILEKSLAIASEIEGLEDDEVYRGTTGYARYNLKRDGDGKAVSSRIKMGPVRASSNIRVTARFDYQPDVCKDYKETGYCGYGDSCKFLHDRGNYKSGWQIEREWAEEQKKKKLAEELGETAETEKPKEEELPFACLICRKEFTDPVVTKCGHYFCEACAIKNFKKSPKCFACGAATHGIFSVAKNILVKMEQRKMAQAST